MAKNEVEDAGAMLLSFGIIFACGLVLGIIWTSDSYSIDLSKETAYDLCYNITGKIDVNASSEKGNLVCTLPREPQWDHTTRVIIKNQGEDHE